MGKDFHKKSNNYLRMRHKPMRRKTYKRKGMSYWLMSEFSRKAIKSKAQRVIAIDPKSDIVTDEIHRLYKDVDTDYLRSVYERIRIHREG